MIIDYTNLETVNYGGDIYVHDCILDEFTYDREEKVLHTFVSDDSYCIRNISIDFLDTIGFEMISCDYWGIGFPFILEFICVESSKSNLINRLFETKDTNNYDFCPLRDREKYIEGMFTFSSGDQLKVACKRIRIEDNGRKNTPDTPQS